jgi:hypothetical protein
MIRSRIGATTAADSAGGIRPRIGADRVTSEPRAVEDIIPASARLPLALAIVAARAATQPNVPLSRLALRLRGGLDAFDTASTLTNVRSVFSAKQSSASGNKPSTCHTNSPTALERLPPTMCNCTLNPGRKHRKPSLSVALDHG